MAILIRIRTHASAPTIGVDQLGDLGYPIPGSGGFVDLEDPADVEEAQNSNDLRTLLVDNAYPPDATLILVDGATLTDVPQADAIEYLDSFQGVNQNLGGFSESQHRAVDQLVHRLAENSYTEPTLDGFGRPTAITTWTSPAKTTKIRECIVTYTGGLPTQVVENQYDASGTLVETVTETIAYAGSNPIIPSSITAVLT